MSVLLAALALPWLAAGAVAYVLLYAFRSAVRAGKFIAGRIKSSRALQGPSEAQKVPQVPPGPSDAAERTLGPFTGHRRGGSTRA